MKIFSAFLVLALPAQVFAAPIAPALLAAFSKAGLVLGLSLRPDGSVRYARRDLRTGAVVLDILSPASVERVEAFLLKVPAEDPETASAKALLNYLRPRLAADKLENNEFLMKDASGRLRLTEAGKNALMDILTAQDGQLIDVPGPPKPQPGSTPRPMRSIFGARGPFDRSGALAAAGRAAGEPSYFDGSARHQVAGFDWDALERETSVKAGLKSLGPGVLDGYAVDRRAGTVRVLIAAGRAVKTDRFKTESDKDRAAVLKETGLDGKTLAGHGAKVARAVDNLVAVDVPLEEAAKLGKELAKKGILSAPARLYKAFSAAAGALAGGPAGALLGGQFLPIPVAAEPGLSPQNMDGRGLMSIPALWGGGMDGKGATVGIIDSGVDADHPDLKGKIAGYMDFTDEGKADVVGHGTHVAGSIGGTGAASDGKYKGMAPGTRLMIAKVFGSKGETSEDVLLAAMKWMADAKEKPDVLNLSLGGPGEPNVDPLSSMANELMIKRNILVVAAAGNEGPLSGTVGSPGSARYILTVTGVNKQGRFSFFPSRGPVAASGGGYNKPDLTTVAGDVNVPPASLWEALKGSQGGAAGLKSAGPADAKCVFGPGIISARSSADPDAGCALAGNDKYRFMAGTSMAAPMAAGVAADVIGYMKANGAKVDATQVKAVLMETARDLQASRETQGAGLVDGGSLMAAVASRVRHGLPVGNVAYVLAMRLTTGDLEAMKTQERYRETALGLLDTRTGHLINTERDMESVIRVLRKGRPAPTPLVARLEDSQNFSYCGFQSREKLSESPVMAL